MISRIVGISLLAIITIVGMGPHNIRSFLDLPSIQFVLGLTLAALFISFDLSTMLQSFGVLTGSIKLKNEIEFQKHIRFWELASRYAIGGGAVGTLIGLILMLGNMSDIESIGPNMAVALICVLYGIIFSELIFQPFKNIVIEKLENSQIDITKDYKKRSFANWLIIVLSVFYPVLIFFMLFLSMSTTIEDVSSLKINSKHLFKAL